MSSSPIPDSRPLGAEPESLDRRRAWPTAQPWVSLVLRLVLGGIALWAGAAKIRDLPASVRAVRAYDLLPTAIEPFVGHALPALEVVVGILLVLGLLTRYAALANALFMLGFVIGVSSAWARGLTIDCGCFGGGGEVDPDETQYVTVLLRDGAILAASLVLARWPRSRWSLDGALRLETA